MAAHRWCSPRCASCTHSYTGQNGGCGDPWCHAHDLVHLSANLQLFPVPLITTEKVSASQNLAKIICWYAPHPRPHCRIRDKGPISMWEDEQRQTPDASLKRGRAEPFERAARPTLVWMISNAKPYGPKDWTPTIPRSSRR